MKLIECLLAPYNLYLRSDIAKQPRFALIGTCLSEYMVDVADSKGLQVDHYLWETFANGPMPEIHGEDVDGIIVHVTLRHILDMTVGVGRGDTCYINSPIQQLSIDAAELMKSRIDDVAKHYKLTKPLFFLSFIEPPQTTKSFFYNNRSDSIYRLVRNLNDQMAQHLSQYTDAYYVEVNDILAYYGGGETLDSYFSHFTHAGNVGKKQSEYFCLAIFQRVINALETIHAINPIKLIITDLDNTLWKGVAAEEDEIVPWIHSEGWPIGYVEALLECKRRGLILAVCSKNNENETLNNFGKIWGWKIGPEDFFSLKINWRPKSENIQEILNEANILPSNTLFIDDNPLEIEEVNRVFPEIRTLAPPQNLWRNVLLHSPQTQVVTLTEEGQNKTALLRAKVERDKMSVSMNRDEYLVSLQLQVNVELITNTTHPLYVRARELLNKTNQFNTTGQRWSDNDLVHVFNSDNLIIYTASVKDRLANHGLTCLALVSDNEIIQFVLSCRIFGLGVETALLYSVMQSLHNDGIQTITARSKNTGRNSSSRDFYSNHSFHLVSTDKDDIQTWVGTDLPTFPSWIHS